VRPTYERRLHITIVLGLLTTASLRVERLIDGFVRVSHRLILREIDHVSGPVIEVRRSPK
jgi:hypothetical protein